MHKNQITQVDTFLQSSVIIDVRSPCEFEKSHIAGALNFPVLSNNEREQIGTLYKENPFQARIAGASIICANVGKHLQSFLANATITPAQIIHIYCARGGLRSLSLLSILQSIGYRAMRLENGYKAYRNAVLQYLQKPPKMEFFTLIGPTGSGKSELIKMFKDSLDIESLAKHFGSSFGAICGTQPSNAMFENLIFARLRELEGKTVLIEGESKRLGNVILPTALYNAYQNAPKILIDTPLNLRIERTLKYYKHISEKFFTQAMENIARFMPKSAWSEAKEAFYKDRAKTAEILLTQYYDKTYKRQSYDYKVSGENLQEALVQIQKIMTHSYTTSKLK